MKRCTTITVVPIYKLCILGLIHAGLILISGCQKTYVTTGTTISGVNVTESSQSLLLSEILEAEDKQLLINCPVTLENTSQEEYQVTLLATGCSCYGLQHNGKPLTKGKAIPLQPGQTLTLNFDAMPPMVQVTKDFSADFAVETSQGEQRFRATCTLSVYSDVRLSPNVVTAEAEYGVGGTKEQKLTIQRVIRRSDDSVVSVAPVLSGLPENVLVQQIVPVGDVETLDENLSRTTWEASLEITIPKEAEADAPPITYTAKFPTQDDLQISSVSGPFSAQGQIVIRSRSPIAFPKSVHFGKIPIGVARNRRFMIASPEEISFKLVPMDNIPSSLEIVVKEELASRHWLEVTLTPSEVGPYDQSITFETGLLEMPAITVQFQALVE